MKRILLLATAVLAFQAHAQVTLEVQRLAPQLVAFAGGDTNFANLVNGLALGAPVTLSTLTTGGSQAFTFTPTGTMTPLQIAQFLEATRQSLISRGIAAPTAQQLVATLAGGTLVNTPTAATPSATTQSPAAAIQGASAAAGSTARNISDSPLPRGISDTPPLPAPGVTAPVQGVTAERPVTPAITAVPAATPAIAAPAARTGDR